MAAASGACSRAPQSDPGRLRIGIESAVSTLDPRFAADAVTSRVAGLVHCALVRPGPSGAWTGDLATSWRRSGEDSWTFDLDPAATFHDGRRVTAADVVATYRSVLDAATGSPKRAALTSVASVDADGDSRVRFTLARDDAAFLEGATVGVLPADVASRTPRDADASVGCGPYRVESLEHDRVRLRAAATWHAGTMSLAAVEFDVVPDAVMRTLELRSGDLDFVQNALEPDAVEHLRHTSKNLQVLSSPYDASQYLGFNHRHAALADVRVRRAIAYAIDRDGIVRHLLGGDAELASGLLPSQHPFYEAKVRRYRFDPARARRLLDDAGFRDPDGDGPLPRLRLRYTTSSVELRRRIAEVVAANLADVGIEVEIRSYEWATFFEEIGRGNYDLYSLAWIGIRDPDLFRVVFHSAMSPPAGNNRGFFANAAMDRLTDRGRREEDPAKRRAIYSRVQKLAARRLPYVPLWWPRNVVVATSRLEGFTPDPSGELTPLVHARLR